MAIVTIETPQNVPIEFQAAGQGDRILGALLDVLVLIGVTAFLGITISIVEGILGSKVQWNGFVYVFIYFIPLFFYIPIMETFNSGQTIGKIVMKTRVIKMDGSQANFGSYMMRFLLFLVEGFMFFGTVGIIAIAANGRGQRLGDMAAGTTVVKVKFNEDLRDTMLRRISEDYRPTFPGVAEAFSDRDISVLDQGYRKALDTNNFELMRELTNHTIKVLGLSKDDPRLRDMTANVFVRTLLNDYNYLTGRV